MQQAEIGIIGGSGLYSMPGFSDVHEVTLETPFGAPSDAYVLGTLEGRKVAFLSRHGRGHRFMPTEINYRANIHGMKQLGVERILSLSAVGSLKEEHQPLDFVIPDQFIDRTRHRVDTFFGDGLVAHVGLGRSDLCGDREGRVRSLQARRRQREVGRHLPQHGRPAVLDQGRVEPLSQLGPRCHRHDQPHRGAAGARGGALLRDGRHGHRLRLLARGARPRHASIRSSPCC